jgi:endonuclease/exonuclease/phosphatase (EEP) superfamily protein YafD
MLLRLLLTPLHWLWHFVWQLYTMLSTWVLRVVLWPFTLFALFVMLCNALSLFPLAWIPIGFRPPEWVYELLCHWRLQWLLLGVLAWSLFGLAKYRIWFVLMSLLLVVQAFVIHQALSPLTYQDAPLDSIHIDHTDGSKTSTPMAEGGGTLHVLQANVFIHNFNPKAVLEHLSHTQADVVVLQEVDTQWRSRLLADALLRRRFPEWVYHDASDVMILSRLPVLRSEVIELTLPGSQQPLDFWEHPMFVTLQGRHATGKPLVWHILGIHPPVPFSMTYWQSQQAYIAWVKQLRSSEGALMGFQRMTRLHVVPHEPLVVLGDFNTTPYSATFRRWQSETGLLPAMRFNEMCQHKMMWCVQPSWPSMLVLPWLQIPIDHAFVSPQVRVLQRALQPTMGSDHLPVLNRFQVR